MIHRNPYSTSLRARLLGMTALTGLIAVAVALPFGDANAAGYALKEQSGSAQGNSFAGATAGAEDVTYMFFNPAALTRQEGHQAAVVLTYINVGAETNDAVGAGGSGVQDGGGGALVPAAYFMWSLSPDLKLGMGINAPFGLKTEYDQTWAGRFYAIESDLKTINVNPTVAYRLNEMVSIGGGLQIQHADVTLSSDIGGGTIGEATGDGWGVGATFGVLVELSEATRLGLGYRSQIGQTLKGEFTANGALVDTISADLTTPDQITAGFYHDLSDQFAVMAEVGWTNWSTFDEIRIKFDGGGESVTPEDWDNVWFGAIGATWKASEDLKIRAGVAYDQSPIPDATRTPRIPGADRTWLSLGVNYNPTPSFSIDAGYTHIFVDDSTISQTALGAFDATFENSVDILAVQGTFRF